MRVWVDFNEVEPDGRVTTLLLSDLASGDLVTAYDGDGLEASAMVLSLGEDLVTLQISQYL